MKKFKIKSGDQVVITAGEHKGAEGQVIRVFRDTDKVLVQGINMVKKHQKPTAANPQGGIIEKEAPLHISNLALKDPKTGEATRVGYRMEDGNKVRFAKKSNQVL